MDAKLEFSKGLEIKNGVLKGIGSCTDTDIVIPDGVSSIGDGALSFCSSITSVVIPNSVTSIGGNAFCSCVALESLVIPNSVTTIGEAAFIGCKKIKEIEIPNSVTKIGVFAFDECRALKKVVLSKNIKKISQGLFKGCKRLKEIEIPEGVTKIEDEAFCLCTSLEKILIPKKAKLGTDVFEGCAKLPKSSYEEETGNSNDNLRQVLSRLVERNKLRLKQKWVECDIAKLENFEEYAKKEIGGKPTPLKSPVQENVNFSTKLSCTLSLVMVIVSIILFVCMFDNPFVMVLSVLMTIFFSILAFIKIGDILTQKDNNKKAYDEKIKECSYREKEISAYLEKRELLKTQSKEKLFQLKNDLSNIVNEIEKEEEFLEKHKVEIQKILTVFRECGFNEEIEKDGEYSYYLKEVWLHMQRNPKWSLEQGVRRCIEHNKELVNLLYEETPEEILKNQLRQKEIEEERERRNQQYLYEQEQEKNRRLYEQEKEKDRILQEKLQKEKIEAEKKMMEKESRAAAARIRCAKCVSYGYCISMSKNTNPYCPSYRDKK